VNVTKASYGIILFFLLVFVLATVLFPLFVNLSQTVKKIDTTLSGMFMVGIVLGVIGLIQYFYSYVKRSVS